MASDPAVTGQLYLRREDCSKEEVADLFNNRLHVSSTAQALGVSMLKVKLVDDLFVVVAADNEGFSIRRFVPNTKASALLVQADIAGAADLSATAGLSSVLKQLEVLTTQQQEVKDCLQRLVNSEPSRASSSSQSGKDFIDRKQKECKEAARKLYGVEPRYCQVTGRTWEEPEVVSCSHIISRGWHRKNPLDFKRAGLKDEWDPRGTLSFIKRFEEEFDRGNVCLMWSGLDDKQLDSYKVKVLDPSLLSKPLPKTQDGDGITFGKVNDEGIFFPNDERPSRRAVNLHASWAHKQAACKRAPGARPSALTLNNMKLSESVWSGYSWKDYVEDWLANDG